MTKPDTRIGAITTKTFRTMRATLDEFEAYWAGLKDRPRPSPGRRSVRRGHGKHQEAEG